MAGNTIGNDASVVHARAGKRPRALVAGLARCVGHDVGR